MTKHTPGPWRRTALYDVEAPVGDNGFYRIVATTGSSVAERLANARLIVAAPDLLAALEVARKTIGALHGPVAWRQYLASPEMRKIDAAIAKAEGEDG